MLIVSAPALHLHRYLDKYVQLWQRLPGCAGVLPLRPPISSILMPPLGDALAARAVAKCQEQISRLPSSTRVLLHVFSGGGYIFAGEGSTAVQRCCLILWCTYLSRGIGFEGRLVLPDQHRRAASVGHGVGKVQCKRAKQSHGAAYESCMHAPGPAPGHACPCPCPWPCLPMPMPLAMPMALPAHAPGPAHGHACPCPWPCQWH